MATLGSQTFSFVGLWCPAIGTRVNEHDLIYKTTSFYANMLIVFCKEKSIKFHLALV